MFLVQKKGGFVETATDWKTEEEEEVQEKFEPSLKELAYDSDCHAGSGTAF